MSEINVIKGDRDHSRHPKIPISILLDRLRSAHNVGNILRLADAVNAEKVICGGYTACPPHPKLEKSAMGADKIVSTEHVDNSLDAIREYKKNGYTVIGVETVENAESIFDIQLNWPTLLVFGNEALGIQEENLKECDSFISLPSFGLKNSVNVSNCAAVVLYKASEQFRKKS